MSWLDTLDDIRQKDFSKASKETRDTAARDVINMASYGCAVVAVSPIPFSDAVLMLPMQTAMVMTIGHIYGRKVTQADAKELILELATTAGIGMLARQGIKALLPVVGALLTVPAAFAANWGIGRVATEYFRNPGAPKDQLRKVYESAKSEGSKLFSKERFDAFRKSASSKTPAPDDDAPATGKKKGKKKSTAKPKLTPSQKTVEVDFAKKLKANPDVAETFSGTIHLVLSGDDGGEWTIDLTRESEWISRGLTGKAKLTIRCESEVLHALLRGEKNAQMAVMSGQLDLKPMDLDLAMKLGPLFR